jgi:subtilisin family serine protease
LEREAEGVTRVRKQPLIVGLCCLMGLSGGVAVAADPRVQGAPEATPDERFPTVDGTRTIAPAGDYARLGAIAERDGRVRVIAGLRLAFTPEGALAASRRASQRAEIAAKTREMRDALRGTQHRVVHTYSTVPYLAVELSAGALDRLEASRQAASLQRDTASPATLAQSTPIVEATEAAAVGRTGAGQAVAVLDTGVDKAHPFLKQASGALKVVSEACFSDGDCPGGGNQSTAAGSGVPCTYAPSGCRHGTHVAGIAAGRGSGFSGVARGAELISIQVFSRFDGTANCGTGEDPCALSFDSDQLAGLERVFALRNAFDIAAVNISIGGGSFTSTCDGDARKAAIDNLRSARIATVIASGNDGFSNAVNAPGCISTALTVGATSNTDTVAVFSNSSAVVDFFAPGVDITSSVPGGGFTSFDGTSMATPHVAGAWAIAKQVDPNATVTEVENALDGTGKPVTDTLASPQITRDRIRVFSAAANLRHSGFRVKDTWGPAAGLGIASDGVGLARRTTAVENPTTPPVNANFALTGIPAGSRIRRAYVVYQTLGGPDPRFRFEGANRTAKLVGGSGQFTCWDTNNGGAYRTYRYVVPSGVVTGNGSYSIGGVGGVADPIEGSPDGQGASLVVVYDRPGAPRVGRAYLRWGAMTARPGTAAATHTFAGLTVPAGTVGRALHVGIGDGEAFADPAMRFQNVAITPTNLWSGTEGQFWDDERTTLPAATLPTGTTSRTNSQGATAECLTWSYAALTYQN